MIYMYFNGVFRRVLGGGGLFIIKLFAGALRAFSRIESVLRALLFFFAEPQAFVLEMEKINPY